MLDEKMRQHVAQLISEIVGAKNIWLTETDRLLNAHDAWPLSEAKIRACERLPLADMVVYPGSTEEVAEVLKVANRLRIPVVPVGGGAGVCGGTLPTRGGIQLDLKRMDRILSIDHSSMTVTVEAGVVGIDLEGAVNRLGYTTGHTPSSMRASTVGGFLATRSGGSMSSLYGKIEDLTLGLRVVLADGTIVDCKAVPRHSVGPDLRQLFIGSEGTLCVITEATLRLFPLPEERRFRTFAFDDIHSGLEAIRLIFRKGVTPSIVRLYDPEDTAFTFTGKFDVGDGECLLLLAFDGSREQVDLDDKVASRVCKEAGGRDVGEGPSRHWWEHRYDMYYPTPLTTGGYSIGDTIDVVATYDRLERVYWAMKEVMESHDAIVLAHFSHMYQNGGSIYMIFFVSMPDAESAWERYKQIWDDGVEACLREGGTMSHQHGVGLWRSTYTEPELGTSFDVLRRIKAVLDPNGILNPDKLGLKGD